MSSIAASPTPSAPSGGGGGGASNATSATAAGSGPAAAEEQAELLAAALNVVKVQAFHMKRCLDGSKLMDALKHCSTMLSELRTSSLTPKNYYELYMAIFDELRHLTTFLYEAHTSGRHHLSDLYELVQYAGNIVPRLYLMITVGSVYMRVSRDAVPNPEDPDADLDVAPVKELMRDMLEMSRGVQHPTRGLFLRYYLSGMTRDYLPDGEIDGPHGTIHDSIQFILQNFVEMNKLWVRLQHLGHSRERDKRERERKELRLLVGSNLVRLSQLDGLTLDIFRTRVLPAILSEIVSCRDTMAQEYLMEVIIQVFQDDFHLHTLDAFLSATAQLSRNVNVKQTVISLIDRFAAFAVRARDEAEARVKEAAAAGKPFDGITGIPGDVELFEVFWGQITTLVNARPEFSVQDVVALVVSLMNLSLNCYPDRLDHIDVVLGFAKERVLEAIAQKAPELFTPQTRSSLLQLLLGPIQAYRYNPLTLLSFPSCRGNHAEAAALGIPPSPSIAGNYADLLALQPFSTRRQVAHTLALAALRASALLPPAPAPPTPQQQQAPAATSGPLPVPVGGGRPFRLDSPDAVNAVFGELCSVMVRDQEDGGLFGPRRVRGQQQQQRSDPDDLPLDWDDVVEEQNLVAKLVHLISSESEDPDDDLMLLDAARRHFGQGGDLRIRFTLPPLVIDSIQLSRRFAALEEPTRSQRLSALFGFIYETVVTLSRAQEYSPDDDDDYGRPLFRDSTTGSPSSSGPKVGRGLLSPPDMSLRLSLLAAKAADEARVEESAYEFFVQALTTYEESVSESRAQAVAMSLVIGALHSASAFGFENYETLATKCAVHCARLLRRVDQCRGVALVSHLFWGSAGDAAMAPRDPVVAASAAEERAAAAREEAALRALRDAGRPAYRDGKRVLECLQRALRAADSVMDRAVSVELFVEILERYLWHYAARNDAVAPKAVNALIDLIQTNLGAAAAAAAVAAAGGAENGEPTSAGGPLSGGSSGSSHRLSLFGGSNSGGGGAPAAASTAPTSAAGAPPHAARHFANVLAHLRRLRDAEAEAAADAAAKVPPGIMLDDGHGGAAGGFGAGVPQGPRGRWAELEVGGN